MPKVSLTKQFYAARRKFTKRNKVRENALHEAFAYFTENPNHPSLGLEKLSGSDTWTIRINSGNRLFFVWSEEGDTAIFFYVGPHDAYRTVK